VAAEGGPLVPVVIARADVPPGARLRAVQLAVRQVPERFAPRDSLVSPEQAVGQRVAGALAAGGYVTQGALAARAEPARGAEPIRRGERSMEVAVAGGEALAGAPPGARVDVLVTTEARGGASGGRTYLALQDVELIAVRPPGAAGGGGAGDGAATRATSVATLRVTLREAVFLTAAQAFAREVRLLLRAPGDTRVARPAAVGAGAL
jgi:pilus assembly protein CpaB